MKALKSKFWPYSWAGVQLVIDKTGGLNHSISNNTRHASPLDAHLGGFFMGVYFSYHRRYEMPPPFNHWDSRNPWQQYYFAKDRDSIFYYAKGASGCSDQRYNHGFCGHLCALLNRENPIPTYLFIYDSHNRFIFDRKENGLWLNFFDLVDNFHIDWGKKRGDFEGCEKN